MKKKLSGHFDVGKQNRQRTSSIEPDDGQLYWLERTKPAWSDGNPEATTPELSTGDFQIISNLGSLTRWRNLGRLG